ncbi:siderophore ABC transporter substrate-binding protein [Paracoccus sp. (in: a-proteobacteria)]|uniref:siderophore ABC transporter substrate-binding protein n=1 Tax=Paracoccus sp. TaxID=267 RepID=UPI00289F127A|nr:siderophore ABC transporter substrate-binding protein [Paracoccus sp. (in: a-proteobacteria)]
MRRFVFAAAMSAGLALPALAEPTLETARGPVELDGVPQKLVVMDVAAIDTLQAMDVAIAGIPDKVNLKYIKTEGTTGIGTLFEPNLEAIAGMAPDLIIMGGRSAAKVDAAAQVGKTVDMTIGPDLLKEASARIATYGEVFGKQEKAAEMQAQLDEKLAKLHEASKDKGNLLVVLTNGPKMSAYGKGSRFGWLYEASNLSEAVEGLAVSGHGEAISPEFIAEKNPDWLFVLDRGMAVGQEGQSAQETLKTPLVEGTKAWKEGHIVYLPASEMYLGGGGYQAVNNMLDAMTEALSK